MHKIQYRKDRDRYGFMVSRPWKRAKPYFRWKTKEEAIKAWHKVEAGKEEMIPQKVTVYPLGLVATDFIKDAKNNKSQWRYKALHWNFDSIILPYFNGDTPITKIKYARIEKFIDYNIARGRKNVTIWHYVSDISALYNWAIKKTLRYRDSEPEDREPEDTDYGVTSNPVKLASLKKIKDRTVIKRELDPAEVDRAAECLNGQDRYLFDGLRYTGMRMDEANRLQWTDLDLEKGTIIIPGTKTKGSLARLPLAPIVQRELQALKRVAAPDCPLVFPGHSPQTEGKKVYRRTRMFERIHRLTGIKLTAKDLRDYFATMLIDGPEGGDPSTVMRLLRHTNLTTTTKYLRVVEDRMEKAVKGLGE